MAEPATGFLLPVDKPVGPTSHDVVAIARRATGIRRIGHTGTLDPFASGLLLLCFGYATRLAEYFADLPKSYLARMRLGATTDTDDRTGRVTSEHSGWERLAQSGIEDALARQVGEILQVPPDFSAKKVGGERLYRAARSGSPLVAAPSRVRIDRLAVKHLALPDVDLEITCGSGTYIRSIARDVGHDLGCGAHLLELRRTAIGPFAAERACSLDDLNRPERVAAMRVESAEALAHLPSVGVSAEVAADLRHGRAVAADGALGSGPVVVTHAGRVVAMGEVVEDVIHPRKVFEA